MSKPKKKKHPLSLRVNDGWYEVKDFAWDTEPRLVRSVPETEGARCFFRGTIGDLVVVEVPSTLPPKAISALGKQLSNESKASIIIVDENIKFMRLRRCLPAEEEKLNAAQKQPSTPTLQRDGAGPVSDGSGSSDPEQHGEAPVERDDPPGPAHVARPAEDRSDS